MSISLNPSRLRVYKDVVTLLLKYGSSAGFKSSLEHPAVALSDLGEETDPASSDAEEFARDLEKRGPTFIKIGQLLSTRSDLMPPAWMAALQRLQDDVETVPFHQIRDIVEKDLGTRISNAFAEFDEKPLAAASLGQVHRAVLRDGTTEVAVKVQRPDIHAQMLEDLSGIEDLATLLENHNEVAKRCRFRSIATEAKKHILEELDYAREAQNLSRLARNLRHFPHLIVPAPIPDYCSPRVLTMDYIPGTRITDLSGVVRLDIPGEQLAEELFHAYLQQVLGDGFFHADPHPGNVLMTKDHKLALIDLGMVGFVSKELRGKLLSLLVALSEGDGDTTADLAMQIGAPEDRFDPDAFRSDLTDIVNARTGASVEQLQVGTTIMEVTKVCGIHGLIVPRELYMLGKMLLNLDLVGQSLDPHFKPDEAIRRHAAELAQRRMTDGLTSGSLLALASETKELLSETPQRVNKFMELLANNRLKLSVDAIDEKALLSGIEKIANRITAGLLLGSIIMGAAMMMNIEVGFTIFGYPGLAMVFFLIASFGALFLVWNILFNPPQKEK